MGRVATFIPGSSVCVYEVDDPPAGELPSSAAARLQWESSAVGDAWLTDFLNRLAEDLGSLS
jgi:hypothetical protein